MAKTINFNYNGYKCGVKFNSIGDCFWKIEKDDDLVEFGHALDLKDGQKRCKSAVDEREGK